MTRCRLATTLKWCGAQVTRSGVASQNVLGQQLLLGKSITTTSATIVLSMWNLENPYLKPLLVIINLRGNYLDRIERPYKQGKPCSRCKDHCGKIRRKRSVLPVLTCCQGLLRDSLRRSSSPNWTGLCTNSCPVADLWSNCRKLARDMGPRMCGNTFYHHHCKATCSCKHAIY